jgi:hypothetical protein
MLLLYPKDFRQYYDASDSAYSLLYYLFTMVKMMFAVVLICGLGLVFFSGFGNMITEAVINGTTSAGSFIPGIKKYFGRIFLSTLLLFAFYIGFTIVITIIIIPLTIIAVMMGNIMITIVASLIMGLVVIFALPFIILWYPAIFIKSTGVIQGLKDGLKAGAKNYWKLLLGIVIIYIPVILNVIIEFDSMMAGTWYTPTYFVSIILSSTMMMIAFPIIFMIYQDYNSKMDTMN